MAAQVLLFTPPFFRGTISDTPSGTAYYVKPGETIVADQSDQAFLLNFDFSPAAPNVAPGGVATVTDGSTTITNATTIDFTSGATVSDLGGGVAGVTVTGGYVMFVSYPLTRTQLLSLATSPVEILPAQAGKVIVPVNVAVTYTVGANTFNFGRVTASLIYTGGAAALVSLTAPDQNGNYPFQGANDQTFYAGVNSLSFNAEADAVGVSLQTSINLGGGGPIATSAVDAGGSEPYYPGDTFTITTGSGDATGTVTGVSNGIYPINGIPVSGVSATIAGDHSAKFPNGTYFYIYGNSTPGVNAVSYLTALDATFDGTNTLITFNNPSPPVTTATGSIILQGATVTAYTLSSLGTNYIVSAANPTTTDSFRGSGLTINITAITPMPPAHSGTANVAMTYVLVDAPT